MEFFTDTGWISDERQSISYYIPCKDIAALADDGLVQGYVMWIHTAYVTKKDGTRVYARDYGKRCFCFWVDGRKKRKKNNVSKG